MSRRGIVYLVGAGPGDPGLITVRGLTVLKSADVVVYDRLLDERLLEHAPAGARLVDAGKGPGEHSMAQGDINKFLVHEGKAGNRVVRLKGGDPFVFGRGGEEAEALARAGVAFEVVPGVTSAIAAAAYAGIPVTHRSVASSVAFVTGSEDPSKGSSSVDWAGLARSVDTMVLLMGLGHLGSIAHQLVSGGRSSDTPVALVRWGTEPWQEVVTGTLKDIAERAEQARLTSPVVAVIGDVVRLRDKLAWFDRKPLFGKRVLITRTRHQASEISELLAQQGAMPLQLPTIEAVPPEDWGRVDEVLTGVGTYHWAVFTSTNAVEMTFQRLTALGMDARAFGGAKVCAIGMATADALRGRGIVADLVPDEALSESALEALKTRMRTGDHVLLPRQLGGRDALPRGLRALCAHVEEVVMYSVRTPAGTKERARRILDEGVDIATFTSSSTVKNLVEALDGDVSRLSDVVIASIGPVTSATARELGLRVDVEANEHTVPGLVGAVVEYVGQRAPHRSP
ncbi:MAG: uroporphyrinogen-III C-methyltransferase [SAR202 cluster bacterium]|nr:uroporphyrinogen-III C-methyltransferase [SAR202 cluster bacterium]